MANPTTNFGWVMPTSASLVTNLPADFNVFGQAVDTSMQYLLGGTTGQILSKTSGTNMAFTWIANDQGDITGVTAGTGISVSSPTGPVPTVSIDTAVTVDKTTAQTLTNKTLTSPALTTPTISTLTTNGDLLYGTGSGAIARLGIGTTGQVLNVASGLPAWATASSGALTLIKARTSFSNVASTTTSFDNVFSNTYQNYLIVVDGWTAVTAGTTLQMQFRSGGSTDANAAYACGYSNVTWAGGSAPVGPGYGTTNMGLTTMAGAGNFGGLNINYYASRAADTNAKVAYTGYSPQLQGFVFGAGFSNTATNYDGFILSMSSGNIYTGSVTVYGLAKA